MCVSHAGEGHWLGRESASDYEEGQLGIQRREVQPWVANFNSSEKNKAEIPRLSREREMVFLFLV